MFTKSLIKTIGNFFLIATLCAFIGSNVYADDERVAGDDVNIDVKAQISSIFVVTPGDPVLFGDIQIPANSAGTVELDPDTGDPTIGGDVVAVEGVTQAGTVDYIAPVPGDITVTYPASIMLTNTSSDSSDQIEYNPKSNQKDLNNDVITIDVYNKPGEVRMGGLLTITAGSDEGEYTGVLNIALDRVPVVVP